MDRASSYFGEDAQGEFHVRLKRYCCTVRPHPAVPRWCSSLFFSDLCRAVSCGIPWMQFLARSCSGRVDCAPVGTCVSPCSVIFCPVVSYLVLSIPRRIMHFVRRFGSVCLESFERLPEAVNMQFIVVANIGMYRKFLVKSRFGRTRLAIKS